MSTIFMICVVVSLCFVMSLLGMHLYRQFRIGLSLPPKISKKPHVLIIAQPSSPFTATAVCEAYLAISQKKLPVTLRIILLTNRAPITKAAQAAMPEVMILNTSRRDAMNLTRLLPLLRGNSQTIIVEDSMPTEQLLREVTCALSQSPRAGLVAMTAPGESLKSAFISIYSAVTPMLWSRKRPALNGWGITTNQLKVLLAQQTRNINLLTFCAKQSQADPENWPTMQTPLIKPRSTPQDMALLLLLIQAIGLFAAWGTAALNPYIEPWLAFVVIGFVPVIIYILNIITTPLSLWQKIETSLAVPLYWLLTPVYLMHLITKRRLHSNSQAL